MPKNQQRETLMMEDVRIIFRNFKGAPGQYNREGERSFSVLLDEQTAESLLKDGWNVKWLRQRDDEPEAERMAHLAVAVSYNPKARPPRVVLINSRGRTILDAETVEILDWVDIANVDLILNPYVWDVNGKTGIKAYLQSIYVTINEDELERKYADLDEVRPSRVEE